MSRNLAPSPLRRPEFRSLLAISVTVALGFGIVIPILPDYARSFDVSLGTAGLVYLVFGLTRFSFGVVGGLVVDRFGERACTMAGLLIVSASSYAAGLATSFPLLVFARGFGGAGSALFIAGFTTRIIRIIEPEAMGRASGISRSSFLIGLAAGPGIGGLLGDRFGLSAPFHIYATGLLLATVIAYVVMGGAAADRSVERKSPVAALRAAGPLFSDYRYVMALLATLVGWWTIQGPAQFLGATFAQDVLRFSKGQIGLALTVLAVGEIIVLAGAGRAADRYGRRAVLVPSLVVASIATAAVGQVDPGASWQFYPLMVAVGCGIAAGSTAAGGLLADAVAGSGSGTAVGVNQMAGDIGGLIAPVLLGGLAEDHSYGIAYAVGAVPAAALSVAALRLRTVRPQPHREMEPVEPVG